MKRCHSCTKESLTATRYCLHCYIKECVRKTLKLVKDEDKEHYANILLTKLQNQNFECVYTGRRLTPGINLSLDHILPSSIFPEQFRDIDNLVWCDLSCNIAKNNLLPEKFLELCQDVVCKRSELLNVHHS